MNYNVQEIERKWQEYWKNNPIHTSSDYSRKKYYCLDMFPYPSGSGLHVGHWRGYVLSDVYSRIKLLQGYNVLHPMGWDAFGLPAENDAIKKGIHPGISTAKNIATFKEQLQSIAAIYDWTKEVNTTDPDYYRWTQWIFLKMFEAGLAYEAETPINWCSSCLTGLANEEVVNGGCERCGTIVEQRKVRQWMLKITDYAQKLLDGLDTLDWPEKVKAMQRNWIGKSKGLIFRSPVKNSDIILETFSAHFEAFGADTFVVIAPDHKLLDSLIADVPNRDEIKAFCKRVIDQRKAKDLGDLEPEGIFTGRYTIDPVGNGELPIWVASFAIADYGTGIVKCSAHDERDFAFAKKYNISLKVVLVPEDPELRFKVERFELCYSDMKQGILLAPTPFAGCHAGEIRQEIINYCVQNNLARESISYKLRDWVFSRQRYWGEPIPLIHCATCGIVPVPEDQLPVKLPDVENYQPTGTGESPLAGISAWVNTHCPRCHRPAKRETNTMPQWAGSCWYFLRYPNPDNTKEAFSQKDMQYWLPVDLYVGGIEHAILHLLYARFYVKVLHDAGYLSFDEPFKQLFNQGMILRYSEKSGHVEKMSKSQGNVVSPDDIVSAYGSDVLRMYILFMGPPELDAEWQDNGLEGIKRFANRVWNYFVNPENSVEHASKDAQVVVHKAIKEFYERIEGFKPNTAIATMMELMNNLYAKQIKLDKDLSQKIVTCFAVMAPHMGSQLCEQLFGTQLNAMPWPTYDDALTIDDQVTIAIQINGKLRASSTVARGADQKTVESVALPLVAKWLDGFTVVKIIFIPGKILNIVVK